MKRVAWLARLAALASSLTLLLGYVYVQSGGNLLPAAILGLPTRGDSDLTIPSSKWAPVVSPASLAGDPPADASSAPTPLAPSDRPLLPGSKGGVLTTPASPIKVPQYAPARAVMAGSKDMVPIIAPPAAKILQQPSPALQPIRSPDVRLPSQPQYNPVRLPFDPWQPNSQQPARIRSP